MARKGPHGKKGPTSGKSTVGTKSTTNRGPASVRTAGYPPPKGGGQGKN